MIWNITTAILAIAATDPALSGAEDGWRPEQGPALSSFHWGSWDGDRLPDAFVVRPDGTALLLRNAGDGTFEDVTQRAGLGSARGVRAGLWSDFDGDGRADLYLVAPEGTSGLWRNTPAGLFEEVTAQAGLERARVLAASWVDFDRDGRPDLALTTSEGESLHRNVDGRSFLQVPLPGPIGRALVGGIVRGAALAGAAERTRGAGLAEDAPDGTRGARTSSATVGGTLNLPPQQNADSGDLICAGSIEDSAMPGVCLDASSVPTLGMLYPISAELYVEAGSGRVGINTLAPAAQLDVAGDIHASGQIVSAMPTGTAPFDVASTTLVTNLNADSLDGLHAASFRQAGDPIGTADLAPDAVTTSEILDGTILAADLALNSVNSSHILPESITKNDIGTGEVTGSEILDGTVTAADIAPNAVGASELAAGSVTNTHVNAGAAIAGTKISPDFGSQNVVTTGNLGAGTASPVSDLHVVGSPTLGSVIIAPNEPGLNDSSELLFAEDDDGTYGVKLFYDGLTNDLTFRGRVADADSSDVALAINRDSRFVGVGHDAPSAPLDVSKASTGIVAEFEQTDAFGASPVVRMTQNSAGSALQLVQNLTGQGLDVDITYANSTATGVSSQTEGTGWAGWFFNANTGTVGSALHAGSNSTHSSHFSFTATNTGAGGAGAGSFFLNNTASSGTALNSRTRGTGNAIHGDAEGGGFGVFGEALAGGRGGYFLAHDPGGVALVADNADNTSTGNILVAQNGTDVEFRVENSGNVFCDGSFTGGGADYAEWLDRLEPEAEIRPGDVVGVFGGRVSLRTEGAEQLLVASTNPVVIGNSDDAESGERRNASLIAFLGQAPVRVVGPVQAGDFLVPTGAGDGTARAVAAERVTAEQLTSILGVAWEDDLRSGEKRVNCALGIDEAQAAALVIQRLQQSLGGARQELSELAGRMERVEARLGMVADAR